MTTRKSSDDLYRAIAEFKALHPVRKESAGTRDLEFSAYMRKHCRPSKKNCYAEGMELGGFTAFDVDWLLWDYRNKLLRLLEVKTHGRDISYTQSDALSIIDKFIRAGQSAYPDIRYLGLSVLRLQNTTPLDSDWIRWDNELIGKEECWRRLNLLDALEDEHRSQSNTYENGGK